MLVALLPTARGPDFGGGNKFERELRNGLNVRCGHVIDWTSALDIGKVVVQIINESKYIRHVNLSASKE